MELRVSLQVRVVEVLRGKKLTSLGPSAQGRMKLCMQTWKDIQRTVQGNMSEQSCESNHTQHPVSAWGDQIAPGAHAVYRYSPMISILSGIFSAVSDMCTNSASSECEH